MKFIEETWHERRLRLDNGILLNGLQKCGQNYCRREGTIAFDGVLLCKKHAAEWLAEKHTVGRQLSNASVFIEQPQAPKMPRYEHVNGGRMSD